MLQLAYVNGIQAFGIQITTVLLFLKVKNLYTLVLPKSAVQPPPIPLRNTMASPPHPNPNPCLDPAVVYLSCFYWLGDLAIRFFYMALCRNPKEATLQVRVTGLRDKG